MKVSFEKTYPNIARWVDEHEGWIEIGYDVDSPLNYECARTRLWWNVLGGKRKL
ncbi:hypothetical protein [Nostoc sp. WHI]|uniref:hypothetical protein n=1 Tax=Nostoc sp. WHI TaxID=2650611 RepID=UPI001E5DB551|nr:hypothetical protein [Nostoc sp. WHI]